MSVIHPYMLFGLLLVGVPILLHLLMRQKPKRLPFPAFRFLKQRFRTNQRKLNFQNLLLLLLRIAVIAAVCLAFARPRLFADRLGVGSDRPVIAILLFDTSASMEYAVAGVSRLDETKRRAKELLDEMHADSRVIVATSGEDMQDTTLSPAAVRERIDAVKIQPGASSLNRAVDQALKFLERQDAGEDTPPRLLCVLSDRTRASWDETGIKPVVPPGVRAVCIDVGVEKPKDLGIEHLEVVPPVVAPGTRYEVRVRVRGTPGGHSNALSCTVNDGQKQQEQGVEIRKEFTGGVHSFERLAPEPPADGPADVYHQVKVGLGARDFLAVNDTRQATFLVRRSKKLLTIVGDAQAQDTVRDKYTGRVCPANALLWDAAHGANKSFAVTYLPLDEANKWTSQQLGTYPVVCLFQIGEVPDPLWRNLAQFVKAGGGLAIVPGDDLQDAKINAGGEKVGLLPAPLATIVTPEKPVLWERFSGSHSLMAPFVKWAQGADTDFERPGWRPSALRYWRLGELKTEKSTAIIRYQDDKKSPILAEREVGVGRVVLFTSPLDVPREKKRDKWDNYADTAFALVLIDRVCLYLGGDSVAPEMNFRCGFAPQVTVPVGVEGPFQLNGPGLTGAERNVAGVGPVLTLGQAVQQGNYQVLDKRERIVAAFSLNLSATETDLTRLPPEQLEAVFGNDSVMGGRSLRLSEVMTGASRPPMELLPYLMITLLVVLTVESVMANRFYRRPPQEAEAKTT